MNMLAERTGRPVDLVDLHTVGDPLLGQILRHGKRLLGGGTCHASLIHRDLFDQADYLPYRTRILAERRRAWIRHLVQDDPGQSRKAAQVIAKECTRDNPGFINRIVLCELVWVLESAYGYSKDTIVAVLEKLLRTSQLKIEDTQSAWTGTCPTIVTPNTTFDQDPRESRTRRFTLT